jgi:ribosomal protein S27E
MPPLKTKPNEQNPKYLPIIDADAKLNFLRCPHCGYRNTVPFGQAYSTVKCQDCGEYLINKPKRQKASIRNKGKLIVQLIFLLIIVGLAKYAMNNTHFVSKTAVAVSELTEDPQHAPTSDNNEPIEAETNNEHEQLPSKEELEPEPEAEPHTETSPN